MEPKPRTYFTFSSSGKKWVPKFDELVKPYYKKQSEIGCLLLHGFTGTPATMRTLADALVRQGYSVALPCLSGHGTTLEEMASMSDQVWIQDAYDAYGKLIEMGCTKIIVMGLSMGGLLATILAANCDVTGLVLLSTPFRIQKYLMRAARFRKLAPFVYVHKQSEELERYRPYNQNYEGVPTRKLEDLVKLAVRARGSLHRVTCPILILQSAKDNKVDLLSVPITQHGARASSIKTVWLMDSPHGCTYGPEADKVAQEALNFVQRVVDNRLPSEYNEI